MSVASSVLAPSGRFRWRSMAWILPFLQRIVTPRTDGPLTGWMMPPVMAKYLSLGSAGLLVG